MLTYIGENPDHSLLRQGLPLELFLQAMQRFATLKTSLAQISYSDRITLSASKIITYLILVTLQSKAKKFVDYFNVFR